MEKNCEPGLRKLQLYRLLLALGSQGTGWNNVASEPVS